MNERRVYLYILIVHECFYRPVTRENKQNLALVRVFSFVVAFINLVAINQPQRYVILEVYCELCVYVCECRVCFTKEHFALNNIPNC